MKIPTFRFDRSQLVEWLAVGGVYAPIIIFHIPIKLLFELLFLMLAVLLIYSARHVLPVSKKLILALFALLFSSIVIETINGYPYAKTIQQFIMLGFYFVCYYIIFAYLRVTKQPLEGLFDKYLRLSYGVAVLAIFQEAVFLGTGINVFRIFTYPNDALAGSFLRVNVFAGEPSYLATLLTPAFVYYLLKIKTEFKTFLIITAAIILTFSTASFFVVLLAVGYKLIVQSGLLVRVMSLAAIGLLIVFGVVLIEQVSNEEGALTDIFMKVEDTASGLSDIDPEALELLNMSTYATLTNIYIALNAPSRLFGTGIGTHADSYERLYQSDYEFYGLNKNDGYAMTTRIFSEFGLVGILLFAWFLIRNFDKKSYINIAVLFLLISLLLRGGHYTLSGTVFFFFIYYYTNYRYIAHD